MGRLTFSSKRGLRGAAEPRRLLRARPRKNCMASGGKPGKRDFTRMPAFIIELMPNTEETHARLAEIPNLGLFPRPRRFRYYTRFGIGGRRIFTRRLVAWRRLIAALAAARSERHTDHGDRGRDEPDRIGPVPGDRVRFETGCCRNGRVIATRVRCCRTWSIFPHRPRTEGAGEVRDSRLRRGQRFTAIAGLRTLHLGACGQRAFTTARKSGLRHDENVEFHYRESVFKRHKEWIIFSTELRSAAMRHCARQPTRSSSSQREVPGECRSAAGSIFKNLLLAELPEAPPKYPPRRCAKARFRPRRGSWNRWAPREWCAATSTWLPTTPICTTRPPICLYADRGAEVPRPRAFRFRTGRRGDTSSTDIMPSSNFGLRVHL